MKCWVTPIMDPGAIQRGMWKYELAQEVALRRVVARPQPTVPDINQPPPDSVLYPTVGDLREFIAGLNTLSEPCVALDLETVGTAWIICCGLTAVDLSDGSVGRSLCVRIRLRGGGLAHSPADHLSVCGLLSGLFADPGVAKMMHNGVTFDVPVLEGLGFEVNGILIDTMGMASTMYLEMPKGLQFCSTFYLDMPVWKTLTEEDDEADGKA